MLSTAVHMLPFLFFTGAGIWLSIFDIKTHRLPNAGVLACLVGVVIGCAIDSIVNFSTGHSFMQLWLNAGLAMAKIIASYLGIYLLSQGQFGLGDVKFSAPLGLTIGWYIPQMWVASIMVSFALAAVVSTALLATKRISSKQRIAFGPYMTISAITLILVTL